ncbi:hypothetical protein FGM00_07765 [Aggregatimonas sangjinii]|uniref:Uncharacterized protein n=1 Tax=Aggregatimonas sangjinii TaxID=2583587 RepID=A0A5B7SSP6_9FLAO|nr:hypothetical protein [Aggregatimonas sangjinii]QCX00001.1 hypothetical protein FGM00_07765 [Aggregatimonas sangjinii]
MKKVDKYQSISQLLETSGLLKTYLTARKKSDLEEKKRLKAYYRQLSELTDAHRLKLKSGVTRSKRERTYGSFYRDLAALQENSLFKLQSECIPKRKNKDYVPLHYADRSELNQFWVLSRPLPDEAFTTNADQMVLENYVHADERCGTIVANTQLMMEGTSDNEIILTRLFPSFSCLYMPERSGTLVLNFDVDTLKSTLSTYNYNEFGNSEIEAHSTLVVPRCRVFGSGGSTAWFTLGGEARGINVIPGLDTTFHRSFSETGGGTSASNSIRRVERGQWHWVEFGFEIHHLVIVNDVSFGSFASEHILLNKIGLTV